MALLAALGAGWIGRPSILAPLRNRTFFTFAELNDAIAELLEVLNARPLKKMDGSRRSIFAERELPELIPLPATPYHYRTHKTSKVHIDYHIEVATHRYSVPHTLIGQTVEVFFDAGTVEVYHAGARVAVHVRGHTRGGFTTDPTHMPPSHRAYGRWTPERIQSWLSGIGPATGEFAAKVMDAFPHPELGYRSCLGLVRLGQKHGQQRLEAACVRALAAGAYRYMSVKSILGAGLDAMPLADQQDPRPPSPTTRTSAAPTTTSSEGDTDEHRLKRAGYCGGHQPTLLNSGISSAAATPKTHQGDNYWIYDCAVCHESGDGETALRGRAMHR